MNTSIPSTLTPSSTSFAPLESSPADTVAGSPSLQNTDPQQLLESARKLGAAGGNKQALDNLPVPQRNAANPSAALAALGAMDGLKLQTDIQDISAVLTKLMQEMRDNARTQRSNEADTQIKAQQDAADKLKQAAEKKFLAALVQGLCQIAGGLIQMGASFAAMKKTIGGIKSEAAFNSQKGKLPEMELKNQNMQTKITNLENAHTVAGKKITRFENASSSATTAAEKADYKNKISDLKETQKSLAQDLKDTKKELASSQQQIENYKAVEKIGDGKAYAAIEDKKATFMNELGKGAPGIMKATGDIIAAKLNQEAAELEKEAAELKTLATKADKSTKEADDSMKKMLEMIEGLRQNLAKIEASTHQVNTKMALGQATV